ncbi:Nuclear poly(A) polymerase 1 [Linum perenne]
MGSVGLSNRPNGQQQQQQRLGITDPISLSGPSEYDVTKTRELEQYLQNVNLYESREEAVSREEVLGRLDQIVKHWVKVISRNKGLNEQLVHEANAKIFTFGSYRLGVHGPGADIDMLCVGPRHATREEDFFGELRSMLSEMPEVTELHPVPDAHVPVMKFKFKGVSIDLLYAKLSLWVIPEDLDISQDSILQNTDEQTVRSLNGCRVTDQILRLVPNIQNFRTTLRCMRFWAKRRGVYSNAMEANNANWDTLFEPFSFFDAYKNYLQVNIAAENEDDLRNWQGWVESRLRTLMLKIEKYTYNMLQCHPHPGEFSDKSKPLHYCYFMGLQRKQGVPANEGEQFDIRETVNDFKHTVNMYTMWKPGMEIQVTHVKRKNIPSFVFPGGVRPSRPSRTTWDIKRSLESKASVSSAADKSSEGEGGMGGSGDRKRKRRIDDNSDNNLGVKCLASTLSSSIEAVNGDSPPVRVPSHSTPESAESIQEQENLTVANSAMDDNVPAQNGVLTRSVTPNSLERASSREVEKLAIEKMMTGPYDSHQASLQELEELEDDNGYRSLAKDSSAGNNDNGSPVESSSTSSKTAASTIVNSPPVIPLASASSNSPCSHGTFDELEPVELVAPSPPPPPVAMRKPLIRLNFTSLGKT